MPVSNHDVFKRGHTAVITGASSGIGRSAALECALKGMNVWMIDIDEKDLKQAKAFVKSKVGKSYLDQVSYYRIKYFILIHFAPCLLTGTEFY
jgi:NAD(P)-dependent dehydrogenase (short-subunit alcohol dehydrogenase family)